MNELRHAVRANAFEKERTFRLGEEVLYWEEPGAGGRMAYADVREVQLNPDLKFATDRARCALRDRAGIVVTLTSHHFEGLGVYRDRTDTYTPLVRMLLRRVANAAPDARFVSGSTTKLAMVLALGSIFVILAALMVMALAGAASLQLGALIVVGALVVLAPVSWYVLSRCGTKPFDPTDPAPELIGSRVA